MDFVFPQSYNTAMKTCLTLLACATLSSCVVTEDPDGTVTKTLDQKEVRFWAEFLRPFLPIEKNAPTTPIVLPTK